jgi:hypothetical protein
MIFRIRIGGIGEQQFEEIFGSLVAVPGVPDQQQPSLLGSMLPHYRWSVRLARIFGAQVHTRSRKASITRIGHFLTY